MAVDILFYWIYLIFSSLHSKDQILLQLNKILALYQIIHIKNQRREICSYQKEPIPSLLMLAEILAIPKKKKTDKTMTKFSTTENPPKTDILRH